MASDGSNIPVSGELRAALEDLVKAARMLEIHGHSDRIWGHVSMRDPDGRGFWLKRHAISLGEVFVPEDFQLIDFAGEMLKGEGRRHSEWPIHSEIYLARPDILYIGHTHPFYASVYSSIPQPLGVVRGAFDGAPPRDEGSSELVRTRERGAELAVTLGDKMTLFMRNHGVVFCGRSASELVKQGVDLEEWCHMALVANGSGYAWRSPEDVEQTRRVTGDRRWDRGDPFWDHMCRLLARAEAAGDIRLSQSRVDPD